MTGYARDFEEALATWDSMRKAGNGPPLLVYVIEIVRADHQTSPNLPEQIISRRLTYLKDVELKGCVHTSPHYLALSMIPTIVRISIWSLWLTWMEEAKLQKLLQRLNLIALYKRTSLTTGNPMTVIVIETLGKKSLSIVIITW